VSRRLISNLAVAVVGALVVAGVVDGVEVAAGVEEEEL